MGHITFRKSLGKRNFCESVLKNCWVDDGDLKKMIFQDGKQPEAEKIRLYTMPKESFEELKKCDKCKIKFNIVTEPSKIIFPNNRTFRAIFDKYKTGEIGLDQNGKITF